MSLGQEKGIALIMALMALLAMSVLGAGLVVASSAEIVIADRFRTNIEALYAADAAAERALDDLRTAPDWSVVLAGAWPSSFGDGASVGPLGALTLPGGGTLD